MSDITSITSALQSLQTRTMTAISTQTIKKSAQAEQMLADMLADNAKAGIDDTKGRIHIIA